MTRARIPFLKAQGAGNDFVVLDEGLTPVPTDLSPMAPIWCCRRTGIGADGILVIRRGGSLPAMECWNADGSRAEACGNGLRIVALILSGEKVSEVSIETDAGVVRVQQRRRDDGEFIAEASLGSPLLEDPITVSMGHTTLQAIPVNMGNPHLVVAIDPEGTPDPVQCYGPTVEHAIAQRANVGFVRIDAPNRLVLRVWERGCGETLACGTGAAAAVAALHPSGAIADEVEVQMRGGVLQVRLDSNGGVHVEGPAKICFEGELLVAQEHLRPEQKDILPIESPQSR
ncbi:MAG: diaminopimelate epimerase [Planctomycetota bacterium]|nr:diaminopimelate epimerase [Planctomycetota bacterium]